MAEVPESGEPEIRLEAGRSEIHRHSSHAAFLDEPVLASLQDHFTLPSASNLIRFRARKNAARVYEAKSVQMVLEETFDEDTQTRNITVKRLSDETFGVSFLRLLYTIVCCLFTGFFFVFCLQVLLFLVLDLAVESGATAMNPDLHVGAVIGVVLAMVVFVHSFAEALVIAGHFVADIWTGHYLARQFLFKKLSPVIIEWIFFCFFLLVPLLVMCGFLLVQSGLWWHNTAIVWFGCIMAFFVIFSFNIVYYEVKAAYEFAKNMDDSDSDSFLSVIKRCVLLRQRHLYSGKFQSVFLARSYVLDSEDTENTERSTIYEETRVVTKSWWAILSTKFTDKMFKQLEHPYRLFTIEDVQDYRPFLTKATWGLEKIFCRPSNSRYIAIVEGPGALSRSQLRSSLVCSLIGTALIIIVFVAFLVWFQIPGAFVAFAFFIALIASWNALNNTRNLFKIGQDILDIKMGRLKGKDDKPEDEGQKPEDEEKAEANESKEEEVASGPEESWQDNPEDKAKFALPPRDASQHLWNKVGAQPSEAVYLVSEYTRVTEATDVFCWLMVPLELLVFYVYPLATLSDINSSLAVLFVICATVATIRHYINVATLIEETGNINLVGGRTDKQKWENKSRLNNIVGHVTAAKTRKLWVSILGGLGFGILAIFLGAVGTSTANTNTKTFTYLPNFYYPPSSDDMRYPTCTLSNMHGGFGANSTLADFAFLSSIAYQINPQSALNSWFGPAGIEAIDEYEYVADFRTEANASDVAVFFKLFSFPQQDFAMIVIRGTSNNWDMLADVQLWSAAALMQGLRAVLPVGGIWTPILAQLVNWINKLQSQSLEKVSFYKLTTEFANYVKNDNNTFSNVQITGHSLGGGLSIITGAQAGIPAVGLSGPNALISGRSFDPPVTKEQLNQYTFNIVPRRDIVPMLDDKADQFQYIRCEAEPWDFVGCHYSKRSLCEILYTCGSGNRPAICECYVDYGYPKPLTDGDEDFDTLCGVTSDQ